MVAFTMRGIWSVTWHATTIVVCAVVNVSTIFFTGVALAVDANMVTHALFAVAVAHFSLVLLCTVVCMATSTRKLEGSDGKPVKRIVYRFFLNLMHFLCLLPVFMWLVTIGIMSRWKPVDDDSNYFVTRTFYGDGFLAANLICGTIVQLLATVILREWGPDGKCVDVQKDPIPTTTIALHAACGRVQGALALTVGGVVLFGTPVFWTNFFPVYVVELILLALATLFAWTVAREVIGGPNTAPMQLASVRIGSLNAWESVKKSNTARRAVRYFGEYASAMGVGVSLAFIVWCGVRAFMCTACIASTTGDLCMYAFFVIDVLSTIVAFATTGLLVMLVRIEAYYYAYAADRQKAHNELKTK